MGTDDSSQPLDVDKAVICSEPSAGAVVTNLGVRGSHEVNEPSIAQSAALVVCGKEGAEDQPKAKDPLRLLDLPVDILREIINQLPHTNDLTSLALTHSAFHNLTVPNIYCRFDIVWPDTSTHSEPRTGVDALTYGLATLVMAEEVFGEHGSASNGTHNSVSTGRGGVSGGHLAAMRRRGNWYAQHTKKFSLGNGPPDWVQEYLISKEGGKMLGTLVALAVARMRKLETFVWDMPTGVLRDVWLALSSLENRRDGLPCRLERVWIRWHDNSQSEGTSSAPPPPVPVSNVPLHGAQMNLPGDTVPLPAAQPSLLAADALECVEHPSFSVLPPLKALSVLDIDELTYLEEMSVLICRSLPKLRELRIGIATHAQLRDWVTAREGPSTTSADAEDLQSSAQRADEKGSHGVLGVLFSHIRDAANACPALSSSSTFPPLQMCDFAQTPRGADDPAAVVDETLQAGDGVTASPGEKIDSEVAKEEANVGTQYHPVETQLKLTGSSQSAPGTIVPSQAPFDDYQSQSKLRLDILELERVPLLTSTLHAAIDWLRLTSLTLFDCNNHEQLWKTLRRQFTPNFGRSSIHHSASKTTKASSLSRSDYVLNLKKIHTNNVSTALISFIRDALAPNSLECLFLQETRNFASHVTIEAIYRGALRRHRQSLKKILIESSERDVGLHFASSTRWRRWMLTREILSFVTSGSMPSLREIAFCIDYRDWHFFLQRLPSIPHVRSIFIPKIADHINGNNIDSRELALQVVDIVTLRPDVEICYMGIGEKCFEILENKGSTHDATGDRGSSMTSTGDMPGAYGATDPLVMIDEDTEVEDSDDDAGEGSGSASGDESDDDSSDVYDSSDDDSLDLEREGQEGARLRLREILFYDDKVAIFKARHGRL